MIPSIPLTSLTAAINVDKSNLTRLLNAQAEKVFATLPPQQVDMGEIMVSKKGELKVEIVGKEIHLAIPLGIKFKGKRLLGLVEAQTAIELYFKTTIDLQPYWQLMTRTTLESYGWLEKPDVQFSILNISVEKMADQLLEKNKETIERRIDEAIATQWNNANVVETAETFFGKAHQLRPEFPIYIQVSPEQIHLAPSENTDQLIRGSFDSALRIGLTSTPFPQKSSPLPTPSFNSVSTDGVSSFHVHIDLDYNNIEEILERQLRGQSFSYKNNTVSISSLKLSKSELGLEFNIGLSGYVDGVITMDCLPIYDESRNSIRTEIAYFDLKADSFWKQSIVNLFSSKIKSEIATRLQFSLDDILKMDEILKLKDFYPQEGVNLNIDIKKISLRNFIVGEEAIQCLLDVNALIKIVL